MRLWLKMMMNYDTSNAFQQWREVEEEITQFYRDHRELQEIKNLETCAEGCPILTMFANWVCLQLESGFGWAS